MPKVAALPGIPHDIVVIIISSLSNKDLSACCYVCSHWKVIAQPILQRRRVFEFSLLRGDNHWDRKRLKEWRQLIHTSNVRNVRHLALSNRHSSAVRLVKDNASCIWIFEVLQQVAPYLASLHIEYFDLAALKGTFTFPPLPMLRSLTITNNIQKLPLILDDAFPHYSASTLLRDLVLPIVDQLSVYHLPSCGLTDLELTTRRGGLDEDTESRFSSLTRLKKFNWSFEEPPINCNLPTSIVDLTLRSVRKPRSADPVPWSIEEAFPNLADLSNLSALVLDRCLPPSPSFPLCQFKLVKLRAGEMLEDEGDIVFKLLHSSAESLSDFQFTVTSLQRLRQLVYLYCGGRTSSDPTFIDTFRLLSSRIKRVYFGHKYESRNFQAWGMDGGKLGLLAGDLQAESEIANDLVSAVQEGLLPALEVVSLPCEMDREALRTIKRLGKKHHFEIIELRFRSSTPNRVPTYAYW